jgi:hypothetical protein
MLCAWLKHYSTKTHNLDSKPTRLFLNAVCLAENTTNTCTNLTVFGLTRLGLETMIYHTQGEHTNQYTNDVVFYKN